MLDWLNEMAGPGYAQALLWTGLALLLLVVVLIVVKLVRSMTFGTFVAGGRNRKARLAVMDAAAIDSHRRLVLIRRDDVEHLLLIGGTTDIVVERDIRLGLQQRRPQPPEADTASAGLVPAATALALAPQPPIAPRPRPPEPARSAPPASRTPAERPTPPPTRKIEAPRITDQAIVERSIPRVDAPKPVAPQPSYPSSPVSPRAANALPALNKPAPPVVVTKGPANAAPVDDFDDDLLKELEVSLDNGETNRKQASRSLDDEMSKLLGELSNPRR